MEALENTFHRELSPAGAIGASLGERRARQPSPGVLWLWLAIILASVAACGGDSSSSSHGGSGSLSFQVMWEQTAGGSAGQVSSTPCGTPAATTGPVSPGGFGDSLPAAVQAIQIVVRSESGPACCVNFARGEVENRRVALANIPSGAATVNVSGFSSDDAPIAEPMKKCDVTSVAGAGIPGSSACTNVRPAALNRSFQSDDKEMTVLSAGTSNAGPILVYAVPFVLLGDQAAQQPLVPGLPPTPEDLVGTVVDLAFTIVDAGSAIEHASLTVLQGTQSAEIRLATSGCADQAIRPNDDSRTDCSVDGALEVAGFVMSGRRTLEFVEGSAMATICATDGAGRSATFSYPFKFLPLPTETSTTTATPTETSIPTPTPTRPADIVLHIQSSSGTPIIRVDPGSNSDVNVVVEGPGLARIAGITHAMGLGTPTPVGTIGAPTPGAQIVFVDMKCSAFSPYSLEFTLLAGATAVRASGSARDETRSTRVYTCSLSASPDTPANLLVPLRCLEASAVDDMGQPLVVECTDALVTTVPPTVP